MTLARRTIRETLIHVACIVLILVVAAPLLWMTVSSFKSMTDVQKVPIEYAPKNPTLETYRFIFFDPRYGHWGQYLFNSLKIAIVTTVIVTVSAALAGYAFARFKFPGAEVMLVLLILTQLFPGPSILLPVFRIMNRLGLLNTHTAVVIINVMFTLPFAVWLSIGSYENVPAGLEEAAYIDGCSPLGALVRVVLPLSKIGLVSVSMYTFILTWAEYIFSLVILTEQEKLTVAIQMGRMASEINVVWNEIGAATVVVSIPLLAFFLWAQKYFVKGMVAGSVKE